MHWKDLYNFEPMVERLAQLDRRLDELGKVAESSVDPDAFGWFDDMEALVGEGFLMCQLYMIERKGKPLPDSEHPYACGPRHNGHYVAQVINTAGNYHKHRGEWPDEAQWGAHQHNTVAVLRDAGVVGGDYWLSNLLFHITKPGKPRFSALVPRLVEWREALDRSRS